MSKLLFIFVVLLAGRSVYPSETGKRTLVLVDNFLIKESHSIFFKSLRERGHQLTFKSADDSSLTLFKYGDLLYDNLIIFSPKVDEFGGKLSKKMILDFIDEGGNLLIATGSKPGVLLRDIAVECGIEIDSPGTSFVGSFVIDHFHYDTSDASHSLISVDPENLIDAPVIVGSRKIAPLLYKGIGLLVNNSNPLVLKLLTAYSTSYSFDPFADIDKTPHLIGRETTLLAAIQTRNNARAVFSGSLDFFSDAAFLSKISKIGGKEYTKSSNEVVVNHLSRWLFKETGVIRVKSVSHHRLNEIEAPMDYTITDMAVFAMELEHKVNDEWKPFSARDLQLEFVRIDPFIRTNVPLVSEGKYKVVFTIPDVYGVFKFLVDYKRIGYTSVFSSTQVSVRPLKHTEYERFIQSAYPYYFSAFSMMIGVFAFSFVFLHADMEKSKTD
ncbi:hypothetical protein V9T40_001693 [Parthenolecanium corni]|uniref:Dolichyl-diphosphooligosaccharide--protein glycosyltransferase 48 kDa subunit n=1 Tax=Parthenolecanium corni TaxID=536013 RepID=A0AAN9THK1_9HEMI